jgi:hypothetical protein
MQVDHQYYYIINILLGALVGANVLVLTHRRDNRWYIWLQVLIPIYVMIVGSYSVIAFRLQYLFFSLLIVTSTGIVVWVTAELMLRLAPSVPSRYRQAVLLWPRILHSVAFGYSRFVGDPYRRHERRIGDVSYVLFAVMGTLLWLLIIISAGYVKREAFGPYRLSPDRPFGIATPTSVPTAISTPSESSLTATVPPSGGGPGGFIPAPAATSSAVPAGPTAPGSPVRVVATVTGASEITLTITPPEDDGGLSATGYRVLMSPDGTLFFVDRTVDGDQYVIDGLQQGIEYQFQVRASNQAGLSALATLSNAVSLSRS